MGYLWVVVAVMQAPTWGPNKGYITVGILAKEYGFKMV